MEIDRSILKRMAREDMHRKKPSVMAVSLVYLLLTTGLAVVATLAMFVPLTRGMFDGLMSQASEAELERIMLEQMGILAMGFALLMLISLFAIVVQQGYAGYSLGLAQGRQVGYRDLLGGFGMLGRSLGMNFLIGLFTFLWSLVICIPAGLLLDLTEWLLGRFEGLVFLITLVVQLGAQALILNRVLRYAMAQFALADRPEIGALGAINRSKELMKGHRWELFKLNLSFIGWILVGYLVIGVSMYIGALILAVVLGVSLYSGAVTDVMGMWAAMINNIWVVYGVCAFGGFLYFMWLMPYMSVTLAHYYCAISAPPAPPEDWQAPDQGGGPSVPSGPSEDPWDYGGAPDSRSNPDEPF